MGKTDIRTLSISDLKLWLENHNEKSFRAKQIHHWLWKQPVNDFDEMNNLSKALREKLNADFILPRLEKTTEQKSIDGTVKVGFSLSDNTLIEGVLIPSGKRVTACISTQGGCRMGCKFCATARLGFSRNLSAGEIYLQAYCLNELSEQHFNTKLSNIVVMGMGEPLDNYESVKQALSYIISEDGMGMSYRRITISTVGVAPKIKQMADDGLKIHLSVSLHAPNDSLRNSIMPANRKYPLQELAESLQYYYDKTKSRISYEYLLLKDINDSETHARELAEFAKITPCKINLIEYNPVEGIAFNRSEKERTEKFIQWLEKRNLVVNLRRSRGADVDGACGQLANKFKDKTKI